MINNVVLVGRLANDPEMRDTPSGTAVTKFRLAVSRPPWRDAPDDQEQTDSLNVVSWAGEAEKCAQYLAEGTQVAVEGRVQSRSWQTEDGQKRYAVEIDARNVQFLKSHQETEDEDISSEVMINNVVLVGRLANDPEMRYTPSGTAVTNFRLAVSRPPRRDAPDDEDQTDWLNIVTWARVAENCAQYLDKGSLVGIEGRVQSRNWQTQDGQNRYSVEINARNVQFLESRQEAERRRAARQERQPSGPTDEPPAEADDEFGPIPEGEDIFGDQ